METTKSARQQIWEEAIASAIGPLAAYLAPESYGLSVIRLKSSEKADEDFNAEIARRIDLGRAAAVTDIIEAASLDLPHLFRHTVHYSQDRIEGVLLVPRLVRERAAGRQNRIPVLRAARFTETPEALLVSELLRISLRITNGWRSSSGSEGSFARQLANRIKAIEARPPWAALLSRPRADVRSLAASVKNRSVAGWTPIGGALDQLAELVLNSANSVLPDTGPIAFLLSEDDRYVDRVFELVCIGWLLSGLKSMDPSGQVNPAALKGSNAPLFEGTRGKVQIQLFYQAGYFSSDARYKWHYSGKNLRAIPDYSIELKGPGWSRTILLDAKNRTFSGASEIIYKLLGYRENLGIDPYLAIAIAPVYSGSAKIEAVQMDDRTAVVIRAPLENGKRFFRRALPKLIDRLITEI
jgi:hypothetical protein